MVHVLDVLSKVLAVPVQAVTFFAVLAKAKRALGTPPSREVAPASGERPSLLKPNIPAPPGAAVKKGGNCVITLLLTLRLLMQLAGLGALFTAWHKREFKDTKWFDPIILFLLLSQAGR